MWNSVKVWEYENLIYKWNISEYKPINLEKEVLIGHGEEEEFKHEKDVMR